MLAGLDAPIDLQSRRQDLRLADPLDPHRRLNGLIGRHALQGLARHLDGAPGARPHLSSNVGYT